MPVYALVGNPNCGKTTLFNALTGLRQKVGNYPGVTVERKEGIFFTQHGTKVSLIDLPGSYSLAARSPDEAIMQDVLLGRQPEVPAPAAIVCVLEASNLERHLFFATQLIELGYPVILVVNMIDEARRRGIHIDTARLSKRLGAPVVACSAATGEGMSNVRVALSRLGNPSTWRNAVPEAVEKSCATVARNLQADTGLDEARARAEAMLLLTGGYDSATPGMHSFHPRAVAEAREQQLRLDSDQPGWRSHLIASRYARIGEICQEVIHRGAEGEVSLTERIDRVLLHPLGGWAVLLTLMGSLFYAIFTLSTYPMDLIDAGMGALAETSRAALPPGAVSDLVADGIIAGVGGVVIFLPQIAMLFLFIGLLEATGYMARASFLLDRLMNKVGLHGKSFVPLLSSYACAVPGVMATRTIESPRDRLVTILVAPFMTCSARLPVYLVMIATLVPADEVPALTRALWLLLFYFLGTFGAFAFAWFFRKTLLRGKAPNPAMELPPYRRPRARALLREVLERAWIFIRRAGTIILGLSIILWFLLSYPQPDDAALDEPQADPISASFAGRIGTFVEPVFAPLGWDERINVGVLASFAAREVFVSTMAIIYRVDGGDEAERQNLVEALRGQTRADGTPLFTPLVCLSILVFFVFALQCMSTVAVVKRETNSWRWPLFQLAFMTGFAYLAALLVYQGGLLLGFT